MPDNYTNIRPEMGEEKLKELADKMKANGRSQLYVRKVKLGVKNLSFLKDFEHLTALFIDEVKAGLDSLQFLTKLETLTLSRVRQLRPTALRGVPQLETLRIGHCSLQSSDGIEALRDLKELSLNSVSGLKDVDFLRELTTLQTLWIEDSKGLTTIPNLAALTELTEVRIKGLANMERIEGVFAAPCLKRLSVGRMPNIHPEALQPALEHPTLELVYPALDGMAGSERDDEAAELLRPRFGDVFDIDRWNAQRAT